MKIAFIVGKIITDSSGNSSVVFVDGNYRMAATSAVHLWDGMGKGNYLVIYRAEQTQLHPEKKLVFNVKAPVDCQLTRLDPSEFMSVYNDLYECLVSRHNMQELYVQPSVKN